MKYKLLMIFVLLISLVGCKKTNILLIGDSFILNNLVNEKTNSDFVFSKTTSQNLYYFLDKDALSIKTNKRISSLIKTTDTLIISFGIFDLIPLFDFSSSIIEYEEEKCNNKLEIIDYYMYHLFEIIDENVNKAKVYFIKQYNLLVNDFSNINVFQKYIDEINVLLKNYSSMYKFNFLELPEYKQYLLDNFILDQSIKEYIYIKV